MALAPSEAAACALETRFVVVCHARRLLRLCSSRCFFRAVVVLIIYAFDAFDRVTQHLLTDVR
jgi:hypothetical protein